VLGVAIGGARDATASLAKEQLLRTLDDASSVEPLAELEARLLDETNRLGIGPAGLGGKTTVLGVKLAAQHRHPASFFVEVSFGCWAMRRGRLIIDGKDVRYE
jgi:fumarate hydratase class I